MAETTTEAEVPSLEERQASDRKAWASTGGALAGAREAVVTSNWPKDPFFPQ